RQELARRVVGESSGAHAGIQRDGSVLNELRIAQLADEDLIGSVPVAENVGTKTAQDISGRSNLRQRHRRGVALEIQQLGRPARGQQQHARVAQRLDATVPETLWQTPVSISSARPILFPQ